MASACHWTEQEGPADVILKLPRNKVEDEHCGVNNPPNAWCILVMALDAAPGKRLPISQKSSEMREIFRRVPRYLA